MSNTSVDTQVNKFLKPGFLYRTYRKINPKISLGETAPSDPGRTYIKLSVIIIFSFVLTILSIVLLLMIRHDNDHEKEKKAIPILALGGFVFLNFLFLVFNATRLFNILLFLVLTALAADLATDYPSDDMGKTQPILAISIIVLATVPLCILLAYFFSSGKDESLVRLRKKEDEEYRIKEWEKTLKAKLTQTEEQVKKDLKTKFEEESSLRKDISESALIGFRKQLEKGASSPSEKKAKETKPAREVVPKEAE